MTGHRGIDDRSIAEDDVADRLAKKVAVEASKFPEEKCTTSHPAIKLACKQYTSTQWQRRWEQVAPL